MNSRRSPTRMSSTCRPRASHRRSPPSSIAATIARSQCVRSAAVNAFTSEGDSTRGNTRGPRISTRHALVRCVAGTFGSCSEWTTRGLSCPMASLLEARCLEKSFRTDDVERPVLRGLSLEVDQGEWVAAMGPSGCGKSTMLYLLGGLDLPDAGSIRLGDDEVTALSAADRARLRRRRVGYIFQQYNLIPHLDVAANVELPQRLAGASRREARSQVDRAARGARPRRSRAQHAGCAVGWRTAAGGDRPSDGQPS